MIYRITYDGTVIGDQRVDLDLSSPAAFVSEVSSARTFAAASSLEEVRAWMARGQGAGLGEGEGLVAGQTRWLHGEPLRWQDEAVRHKVLDLLGDLGTLGVRPKGTVEVERGGHGIHHFQT